jgi:hypothetical protein
MPRETLPKVDDDGAVIDYLEEDPEIPTQRYCIISFLSPEKVIKQKQEFMTEKFIQWLEYDWKVKGMEHYAAFLSKKYNIKVDDLFKDLEDFRKIHNEEIKKTDVHEQYQVFLLKNEKDLETEFSEKVDFRTNVRGVKVRRVFGNLEEAQHFAKVLQKRYPKDNLYLGKLGAWLPWDPSEHMMPEVEYAEKELNELMRKYKENEVNKDIFFEEEKQAKIEAQRKENEARKRKALEDAKADAGVVDTTDISQAISMPVHPAEGGAPLPRRRSGGGCRAPRGERRALAPGRSDGVSR